MEVITSILGFSFFCGGGGGDERTFLKSTLLIREVYLTLHSSLSAICLLGKYLPSLQ